MQASWNAFSYAFYFVNSVTLAFGSHQGACLHMAKTTRFFIYLAGTSITAVRDDFILYWINCWKKLLMGAKITCHLHRYHGLCYLWAAKNILLSQGFVRGWSESRNKCVFCIELVLFSALLFYIPFLWRTAIIMADEKAAEISLAAGSL